MQKHANLAFACACRCGPTSLLPCCFTAQCTYLVLLPDHVWLLVGFSSLQRSVLVSNSRQPPHHGSHHSRRSPALCTVQASGADELTRLITEEGYKGVRFNPYLWPEGETMTNELGREMYKRYVPTCPAAGICFDQGTLSGQGALRTRPSISRSALPHLKKGRLWQPG